MTPDHETWRACFCTMKPTQSTPCLRGTPLLHWLNWGKILSLEQACKAEEISTLHAQEITADLDAKSQVLEGLAADAAEDAAAAAAEDTTSVASFKNQQVTDGSDGHNTCSRCLSVRLSSIVTPLQNFARREPHVKGHAGVAETLFNYEEQ